MEKKQLEILSLKLNVKDEDFDEYALESYLKFD